MPKELSRETREQMIEDASDVMNIVLKVASRRLVQSLEAVHDSNIQPLRNALKKLVIAARTSGGVAGRDGGLCAACDEAERILTEI
jgi:hypothetical protein